MFFFSIIFESGGFFSLLPVMLFTFFSIDKSIPRDKLKQLLVKIDCYRCTRARTRFSPFQETSRNSCSCKCFLLQTICFFYPHNVNAAPRIFSHNIEIGDLGILFQSMKLLSTDWSGIGIFFLLIFFSFWEFHVWLS